MSCEKKENGADKLLSLGNFIVLQCCKSYILKKTAILIPIILVFFSKLISYQYQN